MNQMSTKSQYRFFLETVYTLIKAAESEIQELEEALETLLKKYEAEQEHSNTLEGELEELSDRQQQEIADLETKARFILDGRTYLNKEDSSSY